MFQVNNDIAELILEQFQIQSNLMAVAQAVVDKIVRVHHDMYMNQSRGGSKTCQKRDDITLLVIIPNFALCTGILRFQQVREILK